jgi:anti-sigma regulatory factor (Ser/Thr protein kinase)
VVRQPSAPSRSSRRFAGPVRFIRDLPIWTKLGLIMIVPTIATIVVGTAGLLGQVDQASAAERARSLTVLAGDAGTLVHTLQSERATAVMLLITSSNESARTDYTNAQQTTQTALNQYLATRNTIADLPGNLRQSLDDISNELNELTPLRQQVLALTEVPLSVAEWRYTVLIGDLLGIRELSAQLAGDTSLSDSILAAAAVAAETEAMAQEQVIIDKALAIDDFPEARRTDYAEIVDSARQDEDTFRSLATSTQIDFYERAIAGSAMRNIMRIQGQIDTLRPGEKPSDVLDLATWQEATAERAALMNDAETRLNTEARTSAESLGAQVQRRVLIETGVLLFTLLIGVLFAWLVARSMARSLRDLRQGALAVAQYGLPQAVSRLRDPAISANLSPAGVALQIAEPLPIRSNDEFGQVTEAFNAVHLEAVRTAAEQAALRASVATMFVNLARRSQILVDRLIGHLDRLERGEQDPDRLSELFQLDHLATRMRRNDENLLVLAGADSTRIQREPAALMDVLRAAQSEVEQYTRVEFTIIDQDIEIASHAVNDLVHLVAELFDNATSFSPPDTPIRVEARRIGERVVLRVEDRGIGMTYEQYAELNERLAAPPQVDVAVSRMMGLVVVARLASRHGVTVELQPSPHRGTIADVVLPSGVLVPRALHGRAHAPTGFPAVRPEQAPLSSRSPFGPPLALESGQGLGGGWGDGYGPAYGGAGALAGAGATGLGAALTSVGAIPPAGGRNGGRVPAWYDLTGATAPTHGPTTTPGGFEPLPQRRPAWGDGAAGAGQSTGGWPEPPAGYGAGGYGAPAASAAPVPPVGTRPPAWPPAGGVDSYSASPGPGGANDMTVELPIFSELESAWFATGTGHEAPRPGAWPPEAGSAGSAAGGSDGSWRTSDDVSWRTAADDGWRAAQAAAAPQDNGMTDHGLPRRVPMAQLVPGGVETAVAGSDRRTPDSVRGLLSAYHRGVQRGRDAHGQAGDDPYSSGKEQEA